MRAYEKGVEDETLACGTGMVACFFKFKGTTKFKNISKIEEPGKR